LRGGTFFAVQSAQVPYSDSVFVQHEAPLGGDLVLPQLDAFIDEFVDLPAARADQVVVVLAFVQLEDGVARFEVPAKQDARFGELHQHAVDGGQAHVDLFGQQEFVHIVRTQVLDRLLETAAESASGGWSLSSPIHAVPSIYPCLPFLL
jgi:hypothetical protein